jgi:hypothetical protein
MSLPGVDYTAVHSCENGDGNRADVVIVDLNESTVNILCSVCHMGMMMAVVRQVVENQAEQPTDGQPATS